MTLFKSLVIAIAMYSKIPMPKVEWSEKNMKYALCFFPVVGVLEGGIFLAAGSLLLRLGAGELFRAGVLCVIPILVTGGIHMDGFLDTMDALSSYQTRERKLEILKDSHTGAFAIIGCGVYLILYLGGVSALAGQNAFALAGLGFVISRSLSGLSLVWFQSAKRQGLAYTFSSAAHKTVTRWALAVLLTAAAAAAVALEPAAGSVMVLCGLAVFGFYRYMAYREFGGVTGDLAGFFLQVCELAMLYGVVITEAWKG